MALSKFKKVSVLSLALGSMALLASCDNIEAKLPTADYNAPILNVSDTTNNELGKIYDALITEGDTNSAKVLSNVLYLYAQSIYGDFFEMKSAVEQYVYVADDASKADLQAFADKYAAYVDGTSHSIYKVINFYLDVLYRIRTTFLGYVTNSSYQVRNQFAESKFYDAQTAAYYDLTKVNGTVYPYNQAYKQVYGNFRLSEGYTETGLLKLDGANGTSATDVTDAYFKDIFGTYKNYIAQAVLPDIYRNELTTQYLYTENFGQIKQTAYRKVDYISLAENASYSGSVGNLMTAYCKDVLSDATYAKDFTSYGFTFLGDLYKGTTSNFTSAQNTIAEKIYTDAGWHKATALKSLTIGDWTISDYYKESAMGTIITSYEKLTDNRFTDDTTVRSDFTNSGAYTVDTGLAVKTRTLIAADKTTHGWYDKAGLSSLASALSGRLFKVQVANDVDNNLSNGAYVDNMTMSYGRYVQGNYFLLPDTYEASAAYPYLYMDSSSNWYLVKVEEAVKPAKITSTSTGTGSSAYYDNMLSHENDHFFAEQVARKIAYSLSSTDTWKNKANKYYVNEMALLYHDTYVYNYFKTTFPSLFD
jgi:hypothetical protein